MALASGGLAALGPIAVLAGLVPATEAFAGFSGPTIVFFLVGMTTLAGGICGLAAWLDADRSAAVRGAGVAGVARLGSRNAARNRSRSLLSTGLIASAAFLIVAIAAGHRSHLAPFDAFWGARYAVVLDPDGNRIGISSPVA